MKYECLKCKGKNVSDHGLYCPKGKKGIPPCEHSYIDENNDGKEVCRFCGEKRKNP